MLEGFTKMPNGRVLIEDAGFYREVDLYTRNGINYVKLTRGFVKLHDKVNAGNTYGGTSHPKVRWLELFYAPQF